MILAWLFPFNWPISQTKVQTTIHHYNLVCIVYGVNTYSHITEPLNHT